METEQIKWNDEVLALIIYHGRKEEGIRFFTDDQDLLQVGKHYYPGHKIIKPHRHQPVNVEQLSPLWEVLYIKNGKVKISFYSDDDKSIDHKILTTGDLILLMNGGHSFEFLEETEMLEIKQGPYNPDSTQRFEGR